MRHERTRPNEQIVRSTLRVMIDELSVVWVPRPPLDGINGQQSGHPADSVAFLTRASFEGESTKDTEIGSYVYNQRRGSLSSICAQESLRSDRRIRRTSQLAPRSKGSTCVITTQEPSLGDEWVVVAARDSESALDRADTAPENAELKTFASGWRGGFMMTLGFAWPRH